MKISFSTLGCPEWSWEDMVVMAKDFGFNGIEVRGIENELHVPGAKPFSDDNLEKTKAKLKKLNLEIPCLTSSCRMFDRLYIGNDMKEGKEYIDLACKLGTPLIRVLGDDRPEPGNAVDLGYTAENLSVLAGYASRKNVKVLIETNGAFSDSEKVLLLMEKVDNPNTGILWDIHHPFRFMGEPVRKTYAMLKDYIAFVHIKDSVIENGRVKYKMTGHGDVPVEEAILMLKRDGFPGYVSLEWVKRWCMELEDPGIVFSQFVNQIKDFIG